MSAIVKFFCRIFEQPGISDLAVYLFITRSFYLKVFNEEIAFVLFLAGRCRVGICRGCRV
jgi:hypothetical protein